MNVPSDNGHTYHDVFSSASSKNEAKYTVVFENLIALLRSQSKPLSKTFQLIRPMMNFSLLTTRLADVRLEYQDKLANFTNKQDTEITIFSRPFRNIFSLSAIDWSIQAESLYG